MHQVVAPHGGPTKQHPKLHVVSVCQADFSFPGLWAECDRDLDKRANFFVTARVLNGFLIGNRAIAFHDEIFVILQRMHTKLHAGNAFVTLVNFEPEGMQRRRSGTGVHLCLDMVDSETGQ